MKPIIILGAGGHAKVVAEVVKLTGYELLGYLTPDLPRGAPFNNGVVLGDDDFIQSFSIKEVELVNGIGSLPGSTRRWCLATNLQQQGYVFKTLIHPSAVISENVSLSAGVQVMAGSVLQAGASVGENSIINTGSIVDHDCVIDKNCHLAPGVVLSGHVKVRENTHIGTGSKVIQNICIGKNCVVAAGTTVYRNLESNSLLRNKVALLKETLKG